MKKIRYLLLVNLLLCLGTANVKAITECTSEEMVRLNELANNVQVKSTNKIDIVNEDLKSIYTLYDIDIVNFDKDLKIKYPSNSEYELIELTSKETKIEDLAEGGTLVLYIYSYTANLCTDRLLKTVKVKLPAYNDYYYFNKEKCEDNPDFKYSKEFIDEEKSYYDIEDEFEEYLKKEESSNGLKSISNNKLYILIGGVAIVIITLITIIIIRNKRKAKEEDYL